MTYRELQSQLEGLSDSQLNMDVTIYRGYDDEYVPASGKLRFTNEIITDVLDSEHPYLTVY
jgi:hypothetical protein